VRVLADGQTHTQTQTDFIICPMLYAIAMGQIIIFKLSMLCIRTFCHDLNEYTIACNEWNSVACNTTRRRLFRFMCVPCLIPTFRRQILFTRRSSRSGAWLVPIKSHLPWRQHTSVIIIIIFTEPLLIYTNTLNVHQNNC